MFHHPLVVSKTCYESFVQKKTYKILERSHHPMAISANCFDTQGIPKGQTPRVASDASPALCRLVAASLLWMLRNPAPPNRWYFNPINNGINLLSTGAGFRWPIHSRTESPLDVGEILIRSPHPQSSICAMSILKKHSCGVPNHPNPKKKFSENPLGIHWSQKILHPHHPNGFWGSPNI